MKKHKLIIVLAICVTAIFLAFIFTRNRVQIYQYISNLTSDNTKYSVVLTLEYTDKLNEIANTFNSYITKKVSDINQKSKESGTNNFYILSCIAKVKDNALVTEIKYSYMGKETVTEQRFFMIGNTLESNIGNSSDKADNIFKMISLTTMPIAYGIYQGIDEPTIEKMMNDIKNPSLDKNGWEFLDSASEASVKMDISKNYRF